MYENYYRRVNLTNVYEHGSNYVPWLLDFATSVTLPSDFKQRIPGLLPWPISRSVPENCSRALYITGLNAEPWVSKTSSLVEALLCGHLSACEGGHGQRKPPDVFLNIISLCCHYRSRWAFGWRRTHNKTDFWFPIFLKITHAGTPSEHLASAANYVSIFGHCTPTQQVDTSSHGERHA